MRLSTTAVALTVGSVMLAGCFARGAFAQRDERTLSIEELRAGFANPPAQARLRCYWWWLNGNTDKATITHDLEEMKAKGFGGALLVDANGSGQAGNREVPHGPMFGTPAWIALYTHALREADRLGLEITLNITSGWNLGGPFVKPEEASKILTYTRLQISGGASEQHLKMPAMKNGFYRDIAVLAYPLAHGASLADQPDDRQGDRHTSARDGKMRGSRTLAFRSAAAESGFSMPDASAMLEDGTSGEQGLDPDYADAKLGEVRDLTAQLNKDGTLRVNLPQGQWEILRVGYTDSDARTSTSSGAWQGLAIDHLSRRSFESYWNRSVVPLLEAAKPYKSLRYLATDSWELGGTNWTDDFRAQFIKLRGYDPIAYLPVIAGRILDNRDASTRFLTDVRRTVGDLVVSEHYDVFAEKAARYGLGTQAESGGPHGAPIDALETFRHAAVPQSEFWSQNPHRAADPERFFTKEAASAANIYGQRFVAQEGETSIGPQWSESLAADLKPSFDMAITEGMNRLVWHEFTSSPAKTGLPGQEYFAGTHLNPKVTWWHAGGAFFDYLNRVQFMMQAGVAVNDVLYFYGSNVPNFVRLKADDPAKLLPGYDYDVTNEDALLRTLKIEGSDIVGPGGVRWKVLALPKTRRLSSAALEFVQRYLAAGGTISGLAPTSPEGTITSGARERYAAAVHAIWGNCSKGNVRHVGKGLVVCDTSARAALAAIRMPQDVEVDSTSVVLKAQSDAGIDYVHRRSGDVDIYFLRNPSDQTVAFTAAFRSHASRVELWDAVRGESLSAAVTRLKDGRSDVQLSLPAWGSIFVVFSHASAQRHTASSARLEPLVPIGGWRVQFETGRGVGEKEIHVSDLTSWTEWKEPGVKYFSGTATYSANVNAPKLAAGKRACVRFTGVREIAEVKLDGKVLSTVWTPPYASCVDGQLSPGAHHLEVRVTNLWHNRLLGDLATGQHITQTNIRTQAGELLPSGLIGPVMWEVQFISPSR